MSNNKRKALTVKSFDDLGSLLKQQQYSAPVVEELQQRHRPHAKVTFNLNGKSCQVANEPLSYADLVTLAGYNPEHTLTVVFQLKGKGPTGTLYAGESLEPEDGLLVSVSHTGNA
jgi:hypothetical protein